GAGRRHRHGRALPEDGPVRHARNGKVGGLLRAGREPAGRYPEHAEARIGVDRRESGAGQIGFEPVCKLRRATRIALAFVLAAGFSAAPQNAPPPYKAVTAERLIKPDPGDWLM